jgi:hypothetical protein
MRGGQLQGLFQRFFAKLLVLLANQSDGGNTDLSVDS